MNPVDQLIKLYSSQVSYYQRAYNSQSASSAKRRLAPDEQDEAAIKAAQEKAKSLALAINQDIGRAIYIQELDYNIYNSLQGKVAGIQIRGANSISSSSNMLEPDIEFEKINLEYSILVRFELK